jgi:NAD(P)-dependent dehydrogenase (short-subunit alcohol dehydrogenase family)
MEILTGKRVLITGGASGIGRAITELFARQGAAISVLDVDETGGHTVVKSITESGGKAIFIRCDVTLAVECQNAVQRTIEEFGGLDILINSAGIIRRATVVETTEADWDRVMNVNVKSIFLIAKHALPALIQAGGGVIINISSGWGLIGGHKAAVYCASKGAVIQLTKAMALDHGAQGIRVNCICPGDTDTPMLREEARQLGEPEEKFLIEAAQRPLQRMGTPQDIAQAALYLASDASSFVTGTALVVDGGGIIG